MNARGLSLTAEHYTPAWVIDLVRQVMGTIDLDPCSCVEAQKTVNATQYFDMYKDGLVQPWYGKMFINPPSWGRSPQKFFSKLQTYVGTESVTEFCWLAFNLSHLRTLQNCKGADLLRRCDVLVFSKRIRFSGPSPTHDNALLYFGPNRSRFRELNSYGTIWKAL